MSRFNRENFSHTLLIFLTALTLAACEWNDTSTGKITPVIPPSENEPKILSLSETWGAPGISFIIEGENFDSTIINTTVKVGRNLLKIISSKKNQIVVSVPTEKPCEFGSYKITVNVKGKTTTSTQSFSLSPAFGEGYTNKMSYNPGEILTAFLSAEINYPVHSVGIYDLNHNLIFSASADISPQFATTSSPSSDGFGFSSSVDIAIPQDIKSGLYLIENRFPFIVRSTKPSDIVVVFPSNTENAYCESGGKSLYSHYDRPAWVSFQRPIPFPGAVPTLDFSEIGLQWLLNQTDFSPNYITDFDLENYSNISGSKLLILVGHNEYWTRVARQNFDQFVDNKGNALILSGNVMWWQVRYSPDGSKLICYKDEVADPEPNPLLKTINWTERSLHYPLTLSIGADYEHGGYGMRDDVGWDGYKIVSPESPLLEGTGLKRGDIIKLPTVEYDGAVIKGVDANGYPALDRHHYNFYKMEMIGFDWGVNRNGGASVGTFIAFQRSAASGKIVHTGSTNWCSYSGIGGADGSIIELITKNAISKLIHDENIFSN